MRFLLEQSPTEFRWQAPPPFFNGLQLLQEMLAGSIFLLHVFRTMNTTGLKAETKIFRCVSPSCFFRHQNGKHRHCPKPLIISYVWLFSVWYTYCSPYLSFAKRFETRREFTYFHKIPFLAQENLPRENRKVNQQNHNLISLNLNYTLNFRRTHFLPLAFILLQTMRNNKLWEITIYNRLLLGYVRRLVVCLSTKWNL